jgi:alanine racemase
MLEGKSDRAVGIATHFANVEDVLDHEYGAKQLDAFTRVLEIFASRGIKLLRHAASSASSLLLAESTFDLCRVGISLYGVWPSTLTRLSYLQKFSRVPELKPVLSWRCRLMTVKEIQAGQFVGYGCTFRAVKDMKIGVLPVGYYEGLPRVVGDSQSYVLLHDKRCPIVGRICMNMTMIDLSHVSAEVGDIVTLIGKDESEEIHAGQFADWAKTIHYEIFTHLNAVMPRRIVA